MSSLQVDVHTRRGATVVSLAGEAGVMTQDALEKMIAKLCGLHVNRIVLDLAKLTFISSLAIGLFVTLERDMKSHGGHVTIAAANNDVGTVIERCKIDTIMPVFESVDEAIG